MTQSVFNGIFCFMSKFHFDTPMGQIGTRAFEDAFIHVIREM
jgi:hypothetical protein